jgi:hypothetical protein
MEVEKPYNYDHIPTLEQLLPNTGGLPGVRYAIVSTMNMRKAQDDGWERLSGNQKIFTIVGPKGSVDCELFGKGRPMRSMDVASGRRVCLIDKDVRKATGFTTGVAPKGDSDSTDAKPIVKGKS